MSTLRRFTISIFIGIFVFSLIGICGCTFKSKTDSSNTLHLSTPSKIKGLDPIYADDLYGGTEVSRTYEGLLQYHYLKRPYTLIPNIAESMPDISKDGKTLIFRLKKGVLFQDDPCFKATGGKGREMLADDVVYSFKRLADPKLVSSGWWIFDGKIVGLNEWREAASKSGAADYSKEVEGLKAIDRYTIQIKLIQRSSQFIYALAMSFTFVVPREAVEQYGKEFINHPVGTGPFRLAEYIPGAKLVWVRNPTYRNELYPSEGAPGDKEAGLLEDAGKPLPLADKLIVQVFEESQPMWLTFLSGKLDLTSIPKDSFQQAITPAKELSHDLQSKGIRLIKYPELDITHFSFNMTDPVLSKNKYLRQAMSLAYDEDQYIEIFYNGRALAAQGPIPPGIAGYDQDFKNPYRQFDIAKAKQLMEKAGYPDGKGLKPLIYATLSDTTSRQSTEYAVKMFREIGVKLKVDTYSWPEFQAVVKNRKAQVYAFAWGADYPDAENFLQLFYSKNVSPGPNDSNYSNPEFDKLYESALTMVDSPERTELYKKMARIVIEDCPWIFGAHRMGYALIQKRLKNYKPHDFDHGRAKYYKIDVPSK
ncbi:MAG: ABC transporter substrate-binding protein [Candidatus Poribacteria bacterium]